MSTDRYAVEVGDLTIENGLPSAPTPLDEADAFARRTAAAQGGERIASAVLMNDLIAKQAALIVSLAEESARARCEAADRQVKQRLADFEVLKASLDAVEESAYQSAQRALSDRASFFQALRSPTVPPRGPADVFESVFKEVIGAVKDVVQKNPGLLARLGSVIEPGEDEAGPTNESAPAQPGAGSSGQQSTLIELVAAVDRIPKHSRKHQKETQDLTVQELYECIAAAAEAANVAS